MSKEPRKKKVDKLDDDDLFGDFTSMDDFIESDSFEVTSDGKKGPDKFEITADDKKKKPGNARPPKKDVEKLREDDLFGDFKSMDEFIESDSFDVTISEGQRVASNIDKKRSSDVKKLQEDDLFGDFKPLDEFIESDSFDVTVQKGTSPPDKSLQTSSTSPTTTSPTGAPSPPAISPISTPTPKTDVQSSPPTITPAGSPQSPSAKPEPMDPTKSKLAEIAKKRKKRKQSPVNKKGQVAGMFDDLDPFELEDED